MQLYFAMSNMTSASIVPPPMKIDLAENPRNVDGRPFAALCSQSRVVLHLAIDVTHLLFWAKCYLPFREFETIMQHQSSLDIWFVFSTLLFLLSDLFFKL